MKYYWTRCGGCGCEVAINLTEQGGRGSGSLRRWSTDRTINDGKPLEVPAASRGADGGFRAACVCGFEIDVAGKPSAVGAEREENLRVSLSE